MLCFCCIRAAAQEEPADYTCIGQFVQGSEEEPWLRDEEYEYLPEQLKDTRIYRFQRITGYVEHCPKEYEFTANTYINIIMEKAYFDQHFNFEDPVSIQLKDAGESIEMELEEGNVQNVPLLTLYDAEAGEYMTGQVLAGADPLGGAVFHGMGYIEEFMEDCHLLPELMPDAGVYKFHILHTTDPVTKDYVFVLCSKAFYEEKKTQNIGIEILCALNYGFQYKGQPPVVSDGINNSGLP